MNENRASKFRFVEDKIVANTIYVIFLFASIVAPFGAFVKWLSLHKGTKSDKRFKSSLIL